MECICHCYNFILESDLLFSIRSLGSRHPMDVRMGRSGGSVRRSSRPRDGLGVARRNEYDGVHDKSEVAAACKHNKLRGGRRSQQEIGKRRRELMAELPGIEQLGGDRTVVIQPGRGGSLHHIAPGGSLVLGVPNRLRSPPLVPAADCPRRDEHARSCRRKTICNDEPCAADMRSPALPSRSCGLSSSPARPPTFRRTTTPRPVRTCR